MHNPVFDDRTKDSMLLHEIYYGKPGSFGVVFSSGTAWNENRRFGLRTLRDFGFGKRTAENLILDESAYMIEHFK